MALEDDKDQLIAAAMDLPGVAEITAVYQAAAQRFYAPQRTVTAFSFATNANPTQ
nr:hypothetical protein [Mycobacterium gordonae]